MNNDTPNNSREDALTPSQPLQRKILAGPLAVSIVADDRQQDKRRGQEPIGLITLHIGVEGDWNSHGQQFKIG